MKSDLADSQDERPAPQDTISDETFQQWTNNWYLHGKDFTDTFLVRYFDMPLIDLKEVIGEAPSEARYYNGLEDLGEGHFEPHLILAGVGSDGQIVGPYFDVSSPCPQECN